MACAPVPAHFRAPWKEPRLKGSSRGRKIDVDDALLQGFIPRHLAFEPVPRELVKSIRTIHDRLDRKAIRPTMVFAPDDRRAFRDTSYSWGTVGRVQTSRGSASGVESSTSVERAVPSPSVSSLSNRCKKRPPGTSAGALLDRRRGVDPETVRIARERLPGVPIDKGDMVEFELGKRLDVVTCVFSSIRSSSRVFGAIGRTARSNRRDRRRRRSQC
jgi:hypothetical protein